MQRTRKCNLPVELAEFDNLVDYVQRRGNHWVSSCPACRDDGHKGSSWPDRCLWFIDHSKPRGFCTHCRQLFFPGRKDKNIGSEEMLARYQAMREADARRREAEAHVLNTKVAQFVDGKYWLRAHENLDNTHRHYWEQAGIPESYQNFWKLGYVPDRTFLVENNKYKTEAYTIPIFDINFLPVNMQYRLMRDDIPLGGRYRFEIPKRFSIFVARPDLDWDKVEELWIVEGSKKAAVAYINIPESRPDTRQIIAISSVSWWQDLSDILPYELPKLIIPDPEAMIRPDRAPATWSPHPVEMGRAIGTSRILSLPGKIDDMIVKSHISGDRILSMTRMATKVE